MIGLEILTWGTEGEKNPYYYPVYHYLWGGSIGHAALKLTLPKDPHHDALILKYCRSGSGKSVIPHYSDSDHWVVYFSWWPSGLQEEYEDRIEANSFIDFEYEKKWQPHFTETTSPKTGLLRYKFGALYDWFFGVPKDIPKPIDVIVHPHPLAQELTMALHAKEETLLQKEDILTPVLDRYILLQDQLELMQYKALYVNAHCEDELKKARFRKKCFKECEDLISQRASIAKELMPLIKEREILLDELKSFRRHYYDKVATVGVSPQQVQIALSSEICAESMLTKMREIAEGELPFDKIYYNCSTVTREIIASGLAQALKTSDCEPHLFDTPLKIHRFACQLQQKLINLRLEKLSLLETKVYLPQYHGHESRQQEWLSDKKSSTRIRPS